MNDIRKTKKVYVEWTDSFAQKGWQHRNFLDNRETKICSIGFLIEERSESITISTSLSTNNSVMDALTIPKRAIFKKRFFK